MYQRVKRYCMEKKISISEFERRCQIGNGTVGRWKNDGSHPSMKSITKIVTATGMPLLYWMSDSHE